MRPRCARCLRDAIDARDGDARRGRILVDHATVGALGERDDGDPIAPHGDLEAMQRLKNILTEDGVLFLSVPIGPDLVVWNSHRIYGPIRFPMLIDGWEVIQSFGFNESLFDAKRLGHWYIQPVWILKPQHS